MKNNHLYGKITKCVSTRLFKLPTIQSELVGVIPKGTEVMITDGISPNQYFCHVITPSGIKGYCMRVFIEILNQKTSMNDVNINES